MNTFPHKTLNPFIQLDKHDGLFLTPTPLPTPGSAFHIGAGILIAARISGKNKENKRTIFADNLEIISKGHKVERTIIPHLNLFKNFFPATPNILIPILILFSNNECKFAASSVTGADDGEAIAVSIFQYVGFNWGCGDGDFKIGKLDIPTSFFPCSMVFNWGTVIIGYTLKDLLSLIKQQVVDYLVDKVFDKLSKTKLGKKIAAFQENLIEKIIPKGLLTKITKNIIKPLKLKGYAEKGKKGFQSPAKLIVDTLVDNTLDEVLPDPKDAVKDWVNKGSEKLLGF